MLLVGCAILLGLTGVVMIYSATKGKLALAGEDPRYFLKRQAVFLVIGVVVMVAMAVVRLPTARAAGHRALHRDRGGPAGRCWPPRSQPSGAQRWFPIGPLQLQPSEFATLVLIIAIATYCSRRPEGLEFRDLVRMVLMAGLPILLIFKQPDLGTAIVMSVILLVMLAVAGMPGRYLLLLMVGAVLLVLFAINVGPAQHYQIDRLTSFISPNGASQVATYNVTQAKEAIAHGGVFGRGLFRGHADQPGLRARAADRLHLLRGGGADRLRRRHGAPRHLRRRGLAHPAGRPDGPRRLRAACCAPGSSPCWCSRSSRTWG